MPASQALVGNMYKSKSILYLIISYQLFCIDGQCPIETLSDGTIKYLPCPDAFGAILGTQVWFGDIDILHCNSYLLSIDAMCSS